jgi:hypothetical protein
MTAVYSNVKTLTGMQHLQYDQSSKNNPNLGIAPLRRKLDANDAWLGGWRLNYNLLVINSTMGTVPIYGSSVVTEECIAPV